MRRFAALLLALALALLLAATSASADFGFKELGFGFKEANSSDASTAGSHPYEVQTTVELNAKTIEIEDEDTGEMEEVAIPDGELKDLSVELPPGFAGDPTAVPQCSGQDFATVDRTLSQPNCPSSSAIGVAGLHAEFDPFDPNNPAKCPEGPAKCPYSYVPIYNLVPRKGDVAEFGFLVLNTPIIVDIKVSDSFPYNVYGQSRNATQAALVYGAQLTIWGTPSDPVHNPVRGRCLDAVHSSGEMISLGNCPAEVAEERPFITLPRSCQGPLTANFAGNSWGNSGNVVTGQANGPEMEECETLEYEPDITAAPTTTSASSPSGLDFSIDVDDEGLTDPDKRAQSDTRKIVTTLPLGMTVNPAAATGLGACSLAQYESASVESPGCPDNSKIGSVEVTTPLLEQTLHGSLYVAEPRQNPFGTLIAAYLVIRNADLGIVVRQAGRVDPDPQTGQLTATFDEVPQFPLSHVGVSFRKGPRAPLVTPATCGDHTVEAVMTPWSGNEPITDTSTFSVQSGPGGGPCIAPPGPFSPSMQAGSTNNQAGAYSPFFVSLTRQDSEQEITRLDAVLPPGLTGKLAGIAYCPDAAIAAAAAKSGRQELAEPSCPASSQIGHVLVGAGAGPSPTFVEGKVYLAGPVGGAPLSVAVITPAVTGPFDVGTVVIRPALRVDPSTAEVTIDGSVATPIPRILEGIPVRLRDVRVYVDRPGFALNPTSCEPKATTASVFGSFLDPLTTADDIRVTLTSHYQAANCGKLGFKPKLTLQLKGGTKRSKNTALRAVYKARPGDANLKSAVITLPPSQFVDNSHINNPCTRAQFAEDACPPVSILGRARAFTPLLDQPLEGPVYFLSNGGVRDLPDAVAALKGQFEFNLVVAVLSNDSGRVRTKVLNSPDAPVTKVVLNMAGGKKSLFENSENLCAKPQKAVYNYVAQNNRSYKVTPTVKTDCKKKGNRGNKGGGKG